MELSDATLVAAVTRAIRRRQPVVFFFYHPHWLFQRYDLRRLAEPNPYHEGCFTNGEGRCAVPSFSAWVGARRDLEGRAPAFYRLLGSIRIPIDEIERMMLAITVDKQPARTVADGWIAAHRADVDAWVHGALAGVRK